MFSIPVLFGIGAIILGLVILLLSSRRAAGKLPVARDAP
jgi:hypothetical protein